jgi:hypothetical protein
VLFSPIAANDPASASDADCALEENFRPGCAGGHLAQNRVTRRHPTQPNWTGL